MSTEKIRHILIQPVIAVFCSALIGVGFDDPALAVQTSPAKGTEQPVTSDSTLCPPSSMPLVDYEKILYRWLIDRKHAELAERDTSWAVDKRVRDTGPFINGSYYGTHPGVRIYYSPEVKEWLLNNREGARSTQGSL